MKLSVLRNNSPCGEYTSAENSAGTQEIFIGRSDDCHIQIPDKQISRHQAVITFQDGKWKFKTLASTVPITINGSLTTDKNLENGDSIRIQAFDILVSGITQPQEEVKREESVIASVSTTMTDLADNIPEPAQIVEETAVLPTEEIETTGPIEAESSADSASSESETDEMSSMIEADVTSEHQGFSAEDGDNSVSEIEGGEAAFSNESTQEMGFAGGDENAEGFGGDQGSSENSGDGTVILSGFASFYLKLFGDKVPYDSYLIENAEIKIGRDPEKCNIVLNDPDVSGVHAIIRKNISSCFIEDLNSSNGTLLNGERINKAELRNGDEFIIGSTTFTLIVESELLSEENDRMMPVNEQQEVTTEEIVEEEVEFDQLALENTENKEGASGSILKDPAKRKKILIFAVVIGAVLLLMEDEQPADANKNAKPGEKNERRLSTATTATTTITSSTSKPKKNFTPEQLEYLEANYQVAKSLFSQGKYSDCIIELDKVRAIDSDYKETMQIYSLAKQGLVRLEETEKLRKQEEERKIREKKIADLVEKAKVATKEKQAMVAESLFAQILEMDPENLDVSQMKMEIEAYKKEQARIAKEKEDKEKERKRQVDLLTPGKTYYLKSEWYRAILKLEDFLANKSIDEDLIKEGSEMLADAKTKLADQISPLLGKARSFKEGQDLKGAYEAYGDILKIDPANEECLNEMTSIKESLDMRSKKIYREAIISESLSLFDDAREKFQEVQQLSPTDSIYYKKATDKLKSYLD